ncbi:CsiV family protein [Microbulbifer bruguierae]|uniref:CsiV family protein n=1 Tax=Microbulbifer bruguierae TaxID=3029061 RepID=A0ABY8NFP2_9GAMM|nr:CsiV family protein [Microbulbifer bruguierae]WGL17255.1 CsiV family protein [Microbulbifer bruguierae]
MTPITQKVKHHLQRWSVPLLLALCAAGVEAADYAGTQFEIEMVVFARENGMSQSRENWPAAPRLHYDEHWVDFSTPSAIEPAVPELQPVPNQLDNKVAALARTSGYRVLFHKTWRQVLQQERNAPAVLIGGGTPSGNHHELEGSVTLSVSRYLHVSTDLWLSEWLPQPIDGGLATAFPTAAATESLGLSGIPVPTRPRAERMAPEPGTQEEPLGLNGSSPQSGYATTANGSFSTSADSATFYGNNDNAASADSAEGYPEPINREPPSKLAARVAVLQEERRLRSGELHYIDHPKLGMLIEVRTVEPSEETSAE